MPSFGRRSPWLILILVLTSVLGGCALGEGGPNPGRREGTGQLALELRLRSGAALESVQAKLTSDVLTAPIQRVIGVAAESATVSAYFGGLLSGEYRIDLNATSPDGRVVCSGSAEFVVEPKQLAQIIVPLACTNAGERGETVVNAQVNVCPVMTHLFAGPVIVDDRDPVAVEVEVTDADGDPILYEWSATRGTFDNPSARETLYHCDGFGAARLKIRATDGGSCPVESEFHVNCVPGYCGDGDVRGEEECDPPNGSTCNSDCRPIPVECGDGLVQPGEECEPPGTATCDPSCQAVIPGCGNGVVEPALGEECDASGDPFCDSQCKYVFLFNFCPEIVFYAVTPASARVGETVWASVDAVDYDDDPMTYAWSSPSGEWSSPGQSSTEFTCTALGVVPLTITVDDGRGCPATEVIPLTCR